MRRGPRHILLVTAFLVSACATTTNLPAATAPDAVETVATAPEPIEPTAPEPAPASPTSRPPATATEPALTDTPEPTVTPTSAPHWHWAVHPDTGQIVAVNQFGENHPVGEPRPDLQLMSLTFPLDSERALMLADEGARVSAYVLTSEALKPIVLPDDLPYNTTSQAAAIQILGVFGDSVAFSYETFGGDSGNPPYGPILVVNLATQTGQLVDPDINTLSFQDPRAWAHRSNDGRYLRYLAGTRAASRIRELDLATGEARTVYELTGKVVPYVRSSRDGAAWLIENDGVFLDVTTGARTPQDTETLLLMPLGLNALLAASRGCLEPCAMHIQDVAGQPLTGSYQPPLGVVGPLTLLLPGRLDDGAVIAATTILGQASTDPAVAALYPNLELLDRAVFRLNPDGTSEVLGVIPDGAALSGSGLPLSANGRFIVLLAPDRSALRLLDLREHRSLAEVQLQPDLVYPTYTAQFLDHGIYVSFDAETAEGTLQGIRLTYLHASGVLARLDEAEPAYTTCNDLLADGSILCWHFDDWNTVDVEFARYDPSWSSSTVLLDEHVYLEVVP